MLKIKNAQVVNLLFALCWLVYFCAYLGRINYSSAMTEMISQNVMEKSQAGLLSTLFFVFYAAGQFINGLLSNKISPKFMIFFGVAISGIANLLMGVYPNYIFMVVYWSVNGYALSMIWPPIAKIFSEMLDKRTMVKCCVNITSTVAVGTLCSYILSAGLINAWGWKAVFIVVSVLLLIVAVIWFVLFGFVEKFREKHGELELDETNAPIEIIHMPFKKQIFSPVIMVILLPVIAMGVLKDGMSSWVPTFINEVFLTSPVTSILVSTVLPIINVSGAYLSIFVNQKITHNEILTSGLFFLISLLALIALNLFGHISIALTVVLLGIVTTAMLAVNNMLISIIPMFFGKYGRAATISGILNSIAYFGSAISTVGIGMLVSYCGWNVTIFSWCIVAVVAVIFCAFGYKKVEAIR